VNGAEQMTLLRPRTPPKNDLIDLRCCSNEDVDWQEEEADLAFWDGPWSYVQRIGATRADNHYDTLPVTKIVEQLARARARRIVSFHTWPTLPEWALRSWFKIGVPKTGGAWFKSLEDDKGHYGQGYHWAGCSEPVLVYSKKPRFTDRSVKLRNAWIQKPGDHSEKPEDWLLQMVLRWVPPGGLVIDPYAGRGPMARAVIRAGGGRRYKGTEISEVRWAEATSLAAQVRT